MTLYDLRSEITVSANRIVVSTFDEWGNDIIIATLSYVDDLAGEADLWDYEECSVLNIFVDGEGILHIEVEYEDYLDVINHDEEEEED